MPATCSLDSLFDDTANIVEDLQKIIMPKETPSKKERLLSAEIEQDPVSSSRYSQFQQQFLQKIIMPKETEPPSKKQPLLSAEIEGGEGPTSSSSRYSQFQQQFLQKITTPKETPSKKQPLLNAEIEQGPISSSYNNARTRRRDNNDNEVEPSENKSRATTKTSTNATAKTKTAISSGNTDKEEEEPIREKKKGHKLFFCCCDSKRAVLILTIASLLLNTFTLTTAVLHTDPSLDGYLQAMIIKGCSMFVTLTTLLGALWYSKRIVLVGLVFTTYQLTIALILVAKYSWDGVGNNGVGKLEVILPAAWYALLFYGEAVFISELNDGVMAKDTYKGREQYSCCCNSC